jgi:O-antigen/teichoic acid export membrane protein
LEINYSSNTIAKNTVYNLLGYSIPLVFAVILIPPLVRGLGDERFGILNLAWIVIGYFSFFDFGIGRSLTKITAEKIGLDRKEEIPSLFWTSLFLMLSFSLLIVIILILLVPYLVNDVFNISKEMRPETLKTFYALAIAVPIVSTTAGLRGVLEAYQKFGIINIMRVLLGILTFLGPILFLILTNSLFWIVIFLIIIRLIIWVLYLFQCFKVNHNIKKEIKFDLSSIIPVIKFSAWITVANVVGPIILYSDRLLIGVIVSAAAITYYATPFEVVSKMLLIPGALVGVLFPVFSASFFSDPGFSKKLFFRGAKFIFLIVYPIVFLAVTFSYEGMDLWLGEKFALNSSLVLQFLAIGILMNSISIIPNNFFQGIGKPKIPSLINLVELPVYVLVMWFSIKSYGVKGAAAAYLIMAAIDAITMYIFANKLFSIQFKSGLNAISFLTMMLALLIPFFFSNLLFKMIFSIVYLLVFLLVSWKYFLSVEEKVFIVSKFRRLDFHA